MDKDIEFNLLIDSIKRKEREMDALMPTEEDALKVMFLAYQRLIRLGFRQACYCPKDGSIFEAIEAGSTGIHKCSYDGEWPKGIYWIHDDEMQDLFPSRPILFREIKK